jgi:large subunit ribosomal protein L35
MAFLPGQPAAGLPLRTVTGLEYSPYRSLMQVKAPLWLLRYGASPHIGPPFRARLCFAWGDQWDGPASKGCRVRSQIVCAPFTSARNRQQETKMPKLKTKSGVKKRFKFTATGKVKHGVAGKRHRLISHNAKYIRQNRGTSVLSEADVAHVRLWAPYGLK